MFPLSPFKPAVMFCKEISKLFLISISFIFNAFGSYSFASLLSAYDINVIGMKDANSI